MDPKYKIKLGTVLDAKLARLSELWDAGAYSDAVVEATKLSYWLSAVSEYEEQAETANRNAAKLVL